MTVDLSQSWLAQIGKGAARDGMLVLGFVALAAGAIALELPASPASLAALTFIGRVLTVVGALFLTMPLFLGATGEEKWPTGVRIAALVVGFFILALTLIRA